MERQEYELGERILFGERLWEIAKRADTRWGSPTYLARALEGDDRRWLTPRRKGRRAEVVDRAAIRAMVEHFYAQVAEDAELGPIFERRVQGVWEPHLATMVRFWSAVLLREPGYDGRPPVVHRAIGELSPSHFGRWLELFGVTAEAIFEPPLAIEITTRARGIARGLSTAVFGAPWDAGMA